MKIMEYIEFKSISYQDLSEDIYATKKVDVNSRVTIDLKEVGSFSSESQLIGREILDCVFVTYKDSRDPNFLIIKYDEFKELFEIANSTKVSTPTEFLNRSI